MSPGENDPKRAFFAQNIFCTSMFAEIQVKSDLQLFINLATEVQFFQGQTSALGFKLT